MVLFYQLLKPRLFHWAPKVQRSQKVALSDAWRYHVRYSFWGQTSIQWLFVLLKSLLLFVLGLIHIKFRFPIQFTWLFFFFVYPLNVPKNILKFNRRTVFRVSSFLKIYTLDIIYNHYVLPSPLFSWVSRCPTSLVLSVNCAYTYGIVRFVYLMFMLSTFFQSFIETATGTYYVPLFGTC